MKTTNIFKNLFRVTFITTGMFFISSCSTDDDSNDGDLILEVEPPIVLACNYFSENPNAILEDNPNAPVDYIVTCNGMSIPDDVTIKPGVTIAFESDASFWVQGEGSLNAVGTPDKPITFSGVDKAMGSWGGIFFASNDPKNEIKYAVVEYGGGAPSSWATNEKAGVVIGSGASLKFSENLVQHCKAWGISLYYSANEAQTTIEKNTFVQNEVPIRIIAPMIDVLKGDNIFSENQVNKIEVRTGYALSGNKTLRKAAVPYLVTQSSGSSFRIGDGNLVIEPGVRLEMTSGTGFEVANEGSLKMVGTSTEKIMITGADEVPGAWGNIRYSSTNSSNNQIQHVIIKHAGQGANPTSYIGSKGAIYIGYQASLQLSDVHFEDIMSCVLFTDQHGIGNVQLGTNITSTNTNIVGLEDCIL